MDLSYFDELIKETDSFLNGLDEDTIRLLNDNIYRYRRFKKNFKLDKRSFYDYQSSLKYYDTLAKKTKSERKNIFEPIIRNAEKELFYTKNNYWHQRWREENRKNLVEVLDFFENFYEQFSEGLKSFQGQLYENKNKTQKMKIVKHTTVGTLKRKINESREKTALGFGFGSKPAYESNVDQMMSSYQRKIGNKGGTGLGQGFKQMNEVQMVEFISNMVESLKGKTEYHNLKFVDRLGAEYFLNERQIRTIKSIIKEGSRTAPKKLKRYINENLAIEAQEVYEGYYGLTNEAEAMIPEIKKMFNENKKACGSSKKAAEMTAEGLDVPEEMVQEMYEKMKESYEMKMEGGHMDVEGALHEIYEKYQKMSEGNMNPMYKEISELMMYEEDMPEPEEDYGYEKEEDYMPSEEESEYARKSLSDTDEEDYDPFEEFYADNPEKYGMDEEYLYEDDEMCMECGKSGMYESVKRKLNLLKKKNRNRF